MRQKPGIPTGGYRSRVPRGGSIFGGGNIFIGGGNFSGNYQGGTYADTVHHPNDTYTETASAPTTASQEVPPDGTSVPQTSGKRRSGCLTSAVTICVWCILIILFFSIISGVSEGNGSGVTKSTVKRDKLQLHLSDEAGYYTDESGWIDNQTILERGLKEFYNETGILPYVYITDNINGDYDPSTETIEQFAEWTYTELFDDEGHALLVFWEHSSAYEYILWLGEDAAELMDNEACDILFDYLEYYYYEDVTDEEFFAYAFADAGKRIMTKTMTTGQYFSILLVVIGAVIIVFAVYKWRKARQVKEAERKKRAEEILNSPLEKFGENGDIIDELEKKYEKEI